MESGSDDLHSDFTPTHVREVEYFEKLLIKVGAQLIVNRELGKSFIDSIHELIEDLVSLNKYDEALKLCTFSNSIESKHLSSVIETLMMTYFSQEESDDYEFDDYEFEFRAPVDYTGEGKRDEIMNYIIETIEDYSQEFPYVKTEALRAYLKIDKSLYNQNK